MGSSGMMGMNGGMPGGYLDPLAQKAFEAQQQCDQALGRYQQTEDETERQAIKADLTKALQRQFEFQQQRRMNELAEIESRVQKLRALIEKRNQAKQTIVAKRCDQLLSEIDGLGWTSPSDGASIGWWYGRLSWDGGNANNARWNARFDARSSCTRDDAGHGRRDEERKWRWRLN